MWYPKLDRGSLLNQPVFLVHCFEVMRNHMLSRVPIAIAHIRRQTLTSTYNQYLFCQVQAPLRIQLTYRHIVFLSFSSHELFAEDNSTWYRQQTSSLNISHIEYVYLPICCYHELEVGDMEARNCDLRRVEWGDQKDREAATSIMHQKGLSLIRFSLIYC